MSLRSPNYLVLSLCFLLVTAAAPAWSQPGDGLTLELIDARIRALRDAGTADDSPVLAAYQEARQLLVQEETLEQESEGYLTALTSAPEREAEIQARIDAVDTEYDPSTGLDELTAEEVNTRLSETRVRQRELSSQLEALDRRLTSRESIAESARNRLAEIDAARTSLPETAGSVNPDGTASEAEANRWRDLARMRALNAESEARQAQLESQPVRFSALSAQRAETALNLRQVNALLQQLQTRAFQSTEQAPELTDIGIDQDDPAYPVAEAIFNRSVSLRQEVTSTSSSLSAARQLNTVIGGLQRDLDERERTARRIVDFASDSDSLGTVLLTYWEEIDSFSIDNPVQALSPSVGSAVIRRIDYEQEIDSLTSITGFINNRLRALGVEPTSVQPQTMQELAELARSYRESLSTLINELSQYIEALGELEAGYVDLQAQITNYSNFLQGLVLWIPNYPPLWTMTLEAAQAELVSIYESSRSLTFRISVLSGLALIALLTLLFYQRRMKHYQRSLNALVARPRDDSILHTAKATSIALLRASTTPLLLILLSGVFDPTTSEISARMAESLRGIAILVFSLQLMRIVSEQEGIGEKHFGWDPQVMRQLRKELTFLLYTWVPLALATTLLLQVVPSTGDVVYGRLALLTVLLILGYRFLRLRVHKLQPAS